MLLLQVQLRLLLPLQTVYLSAYVKVPAHRFTRSLWCALCHGKASQSMLFLQVQIFLLIPLQAQSTLRGRMSS